MNAILIAEATGAGWFAIMGAAVGGLIGVLGTYFNQRRARLDAKHQELVRLISSLMVHSTWVSNMTKKKAHLEVLGDDSFKEHLQGMISIGAHLAVLLDDNDPKEKALGTAMKALLDAAVQSTEPPKGANKNFETAAQELLRRYK